MSTTQVAPPRDADIRLADPPPKARRSCRSRSGDTVTVVTVLALLASLVLTVFGLGAVTHKLAVHDGSSWLWSSGKGELARVNGVSGKVDTRYRMTDARGHHIQVSQTDRYVILRDLDTGTVTALDLATLRVTATTNTTPGVGVTVAVHGNTAFIVDAVQGIVRQVDPAKLAPVSEKLRFPPPITGGTFDDSGLLWLAIPAEGTVVAVKGGEQHRPPTVARTIPAADPNHDLAISVLDQGVAVLDQTAGSLTTIRGDQVQTVSLPDDKPGALPARSEGEAVPVTVIDDRHVYVVRGRNVSDFTVPGEGTDLRPAVAFGGRFYIADDATDVVYVVGADGRLISTVGVPTANGPLELEVREDHLFINAPNSNTARVVDRNGTVKVVDKYANNILGGDKPAAPPVDNPGKARPDPDPKPAKPKVGPPGSPGAVSATAGNASARLTWGAASSNGSPVTRFVIEGAPGRPPITVGASQRSATVDGLDNGTQYRFTVFATNAKGDGPKGRSNPVVPTADVPDPPAVVSATANPDGTVKVTWPAADGQGRKVARYAVTATGAGVAEPVGEVDRTELVLPAARLDYGMRYAFTVVAISDRNASSGPSPASNVVTPYNKPGEPPNVSAATVDQPGTIRVSWGAAEDNGAPIERYVVQAGGRTQDVQGTDVTLSGFGDGESVTVRVHAVNSAGDGPTSPGVVARTIARPALTVTGTSADYSSLTVSFSVSDGGSPTNCSLSVAGAGSANGSCSSLTVGGLKAGAAYDYTLTAANAAGNGTSTGRLSPVHPRPAAVRCVRCDDLQPGDAHLRVPPRPGLREHRDRRRDQPRVAEDPVGAARGDGRAIRHCGRYPAPGAAAVPRGGHPEPGRDGRHLSAARGAARPVPGEARCRISG